MADAGGFGRGAFHGVLLGGAALMALSLAVPTLQNRSAPTDAVNIDSGNDAGFADVTTSGGARQSGDISKTVDDAEPVGTTTELPAAPATRMPPPPGSEFARNEDRAPVAPAGVADSRPAPNPAVRFVTVPISEPAPARQAAPAARPDAATDTNAPATEQNVQPAPDMPAAGEIAQKPQTPVRIDLPQQDAGPQSGPREAPGPPDAQSDAVIPTAESTPNAAQTPPSRPDAPVTQGSAQGTRLVSPSLNPPDPMRESVPPPPPAAEQGQAGQTSDGAGSRADEAVDLPDAEAPAQPDRTAQQAGRTGASLPDPPFERQPGPEAPEAAPVGTPAPAPTPAPDLSVPSLSLRSVR